MLPISLISPVLHDPAARAVDFIWSYVNMANWIDQLVSCSVTIWMNAWQRTTAIRLSTLLNTLTWNNIAEQSNSGTRIKNSSLGAMRSWNGTLDGILQISPQLLDEPKRQYTARRMEKW